MPKYMRNVVLFAKIETTYGTDPIPAAGANAILCRAVTPTPIAPEMVSRDLIRPYFGNPGQLTAAVHSEAEFEVELAGAGTAGTAPKYGPLLRACAMGETITAATNVKYAPITNGQESVTLYYHLDGILHKMTGCRGTVSFALNAKGIPVMRFRFVGLYNPASDVTMPTGVDYSGFKDPVVVNKDNTPTFTIHGVTAKSNAFSFDLANEVVYRNLVNFEGVSVIGRSPTGSATIEVESIATKDWGAAIKANTKAAIAIQHGTTAGNIIELGFPKAMISSVGAPQEVEGVAMQTIGFNLEPNAGNDELVITVK